MTEWRGEQNCHAYEVDDEHYYDFFSGKIKRKIETPLDRLGLVDRHRLVGLLIAGTPPGFNWGDVPRDHHWQWPAIDYPFLEIEDEPNEAIFRDLLINRNILPLSFERLIHKATRSPEKPSKEVMSVMIDYGKIVYDLFESAKEIIEWQRQFRSYSFTTNLDANPEKKKTNRKITRRRGQRYSKKFCTSWRQFQEIPPEYRLAETVGKPEQVVADLGRLVSRRRFDIRSVAQAA